MAVYLGCDLEPPEASWDESRPAFNTQRVSANDGAVRRLFRKPAVIFLGAHTGCSCGFTYGMDDGEDPAERADAARSVGALRLYLSVLLEHVAEIELFACWEGDQNLSPLSRMEVTLDHFGGPSFAFVERQFLVCRRNGSPSGRVAG
ncbi:MAG TPA: hypothetical protein VIM73_15450 [Polyangiaceae bacterium]